MICNTSKHYLQTHTILTIIISKYLLKINTYKMVQANIHWHTQVTINKGKTGGIFRACKIEGFFLGWFRACRNFHNYSNKPYPTIQKSTFLFTIFFITFIFFTNFST